MRGISEEWLKRLANQIHDADDSNFAVLSLLDLLIAECKELNHWLPIDENTPREKDLLLTNKSIFNCEGYEITSRLRSPCSLKRDGISMRNISWEWIDEELNK